MSKLKIEAFGALKARGKDIENILSELTELPHPMDMRAFELEKLRELSKELVAMVHEFNAYHNAYNSVLKGETE